MSADLPIYILGHSPLSYFLAAKLKQAGQQIILLKTPKDIKRFGRYQMTFREERVLHKEKHQFATDFEINGNPKLLIITPDISSIKSSILLLNPQKLQKTTIMNFNHSGINKVIANLLSNQQINCYFNGYVSFDGNSTTLLGRSAEIRIASSISTDTYSLIQNIFEDTKINLSLSSESSNISFWRHFIINATISLLSCAHNKNIYNLIKDRKERLLIEDYVTELAMLAVADGADISINDIIKEIYNIPNAYKSIMQYEVEAGKFCELNDVSATILEKSKRHNIKMPLSKEIINKILFYSI